jgi:hypothetical protein
MEHADRKRVPVKHAPRKSFYDEWLDAEARKHDMISSEDMVHGRYLYHLILQKLAGEPSAPMEQVEIDRPTAVGRRRQP